MKEQPNLDGIIAAPFGYVGWRTYRQALVAVEFPKEPDALLAPESATGRQVRDALLKYFGDPDAEFNVQLACRGTAFQMRVWNELRKIPRGEVVTYGELADSLGTSPRPVAGACRANPLPVVIPCHRVLASDGIGGYAGASGGRMLAIKRWLLTHEGALASEPEQRAIEL